MNSECRALVKHCLSKRKITYAGQLLDCPSRNQAGIFATGEIRQNIKFAAFLVCVFDKRKELFENAPSYMIIRPSLREAFT